MNIIALKIRHIPTTVDIHQKAFPGFFLSFLGPRFLKEFYTAFIHEDTSIGLVAVDTENQVTGAVVGTTQPIGFFNRLLKRRWWAFCLASLESLLRRPAIAPRLFRAIFYRGDSPGGFSMALLSSIAVHPRFHGHAVGSLLLNNFLTEVVNRGCMGCYLTTDADGNDAVNRFYLKNGWRLESTFFTPEKRKMNRYVWERSQKGLNPSA